MELSMPILMSLMILQAEAIQGVEQTGLILLKDGIQSQAWEHLTFQNCLSYSISFPTLILQSIDRSRNMEDIITVNAIVIHEHIRARWAVTVL
jgi:hypothetical protein